jgi:hypothetical protein
LPQRNAPDGRPVLWTEEGQYLASGKNSTHENYLNNCIFNCNNLELVFMQSKCLKRSRTDKNALIL